MRKELCWISDTHKSNIIKAWAAINALLSLLIAYIEAKMSYSNGAYAYAIHGF